MKLQCGIVAVIIACVVCFGGGGVVGYLVAPKEITEIQNIETTSISGAYSYAGNITVVNQKRVDNISVKFDNVTNVEIWTVTNGLTNQITN